MNLSQIETFLIGYGQAVSTGQLEKIAEAWAIPSLVVSDQGRLAVTDVQQVKDFFAHSVKCYHEKGIMKTEPEVVGFEKLSSGLFSVDVLWPGFDADDHEIPDSREFSRYVLGLSEGGELRFLVAITRQEKR